MKVQNILTPTNQQQRVRKHHAWAHPLLLVPLTAEPLLLTVRKLTIMMLPLMLDWKNEHGNFHCLVSIRLKLYLAKYTFRYCKLIRLNYSLPYKRPK